MRSLIRLQLLVLAISTVYTIALPAQGVTTAALVGTVTDSDSNALASVTDFEVTNGSEQGGGSTAEIFGVGTTTFAVGTTEFAVGA